MRSRLCLVSRWSVTQLTAPVWCCNGLPQLTRAQTAGFLTYNHCRPWRGRVARDRPVAASVSERAVVDLRRRTPQHA